MRNLLAGETQADPFITQTHRALIHLRLYLHIERGTAFCIHVWMEKIASVVRVFVSWLNSVSSFFSISINVLIIPEVNRGSYPENLPQDHEFTRPPSCLTRQAPHRKSTSYIRTQMECMSWSQPLDPDQKSRFECIKQLVETHRIGAPSTPSKQDNALKEFRINMLFWYEEAGRSGQLSRMRAWFWTIGNVHQG